MQSFYSLIKYTQAMISSKAAALCFLTVLLITVQGRPDGAPSDACETMDPSHGGSPQTGPMPYTLQLDSHKINSGGRVHFTIRAQPPNTFAGFMVQARNDKGRPVGVFTQSDNVKPTECFGVPANTATHVNHQPKTEVTMSWSADPGYTGDIIFHATVAKSMKEYWVRQRARPLAVVRT
uniref:Reelin domain-containing protein n=1 Tax=Homalodisca liturata TaxID=320908 RepID=A0A1B6JI15_9HEMI